MDEADLRKKTETNVFVDFLGLVMPAGQRSKVSRPPMPTPPKLRRGTQTDVTVASVTASSLTAPMKEFTYEPSKGEKLEDDDDDDDQYEDDDNFVEDVAGVYGRENIGPVASLNLTPYVYKRR